MRKLMCVTVCVLMFGLVSSASAETWTNWVDNQWTTAGNWSTTTVPTALTDGEIDGTFTIGGTPGLSEAPTIDDTMTADCKVLIVGSGTAGTAELLMTGGILNVHDRAYMADTSDSGAVGRFVLQHGTVNMMASDAKFYIGYKGGVVNQAKGYFEMSGGTINNVGKFYIAGEKSGSDVGWGQMTMSGGTVNVTGDSKRMRIGGKTGNGSLIMSGGSIYSADDVIVADGSGSTGLLDMTGGYIRADGDFKVGSGDATASAIVLLHGGIISTGNLSFDTDCGSMDITYGTLLLDGDEATEVSDLVTGGYITAFGGSGSVVVNYAADVTTVTAVPEPVTIALLGLGGLLIRRRR